MVDFAKVRELAQKYKHMYAVSPVMFTEKYAGTMPKNTENLVSIERGK
ncbi:hypothetical protein CEB3_c37090 [Peptococcaceae bacterium CEB3]|nr:hypothetical protein CEB3_c37090 [Peptococcaceae bacterium CEB3]